MPRRYNDSIYKDSVGALLQQNPSAGNHNRRRKGGTPVKNYSLENRASIKEIQAQNRQRREEEAAPAAEPFKLRQFKNVSSRFASAAAACSQGPSAPGPADQTPLGRGFLRKGSREKLATGQRQEAQRRRRREEEGDNENGGGAMIGVTAMGSRPFGAAGTTPATPTTPAAAAAAAAAGNGGLSFGGPKRSPGQGRTVCSPMLQQGMRGHSSGSGSGGEGGGANRSRRGTPPDSARGTRRSPTEDHHHNHRCGGNTPRKEAVPRAGDVAQLAPRTDRDFVAANRMQAVEMQARETPDKNESFTHESYGRVPEYLLSRREEWEREAERRRAEAPDPGCPPGMKLMPEEERLKTLELLKENELACQAQLNRFPLVVQTPLLQRRVDDINNKLKEIDAAKAIFSRARVYIARDS